MKKVLIVGAGVGLTGCQLIKFREACINSQIEFLAFVEAVRDFKIKANRSLFVSNEFRTLIVRSRETLISEPIRIPIKEKKPKYVRQQHKLAQRHYRRK